MNPHSPKILTNVEIKPEQVTPLYDRLLVRRLRDEEQAGLIIDPKVVVTKGGEWRTRADEGPRRGVVVCMGPGDRVVASDNWEGPFEVPIDSPQDRYRRMEMSVKVGDTIIYPRFESTHVMLDGEEYTFCNEADVMAILEP